MKTWLALSRTLLASIVAIFCTLSCASNFEDEGAVAVRSERLVPAKGAGNTLDIASWNIEWFGDANNGPEDKDLQRQNAYDVISGTDMDIWGVAEIVSTSQFNSLKAQLPGYAGFLANDPSVINGPAYYSGFGNAEQKVGILYKSSLASVLEARIILTGNDYDFAGRPPMQVKLRVSLNGTTEDIVVIVLHAKCCSDSTSWQRRQNASAALKSYLDATFPTQKVWVVGDFNDDLDSSISGGEASPYANFVDDVANYKFPSQALTDAGIASTFGYPDTIDHHLNTNDSNARFIPGSIEVYRADDFIADFEFTTSDHLPVLSRYTWPSGSGGTPAVSVTPPNGGETGASPAQLIVNEICANEPGSATAGEFIEVVNIGGTAAAIGGYTLSDGTSVRHTFASGASLSPGKAVVVFAGASGVPSGLTNAIVATTGSLSLSNSGDSVSLRNASGGLVQTFAYTSSLSNSDGVSMNRSPDATLSGAFVKHDTLSSLPRSGGTRVNGSAW